jgi:acetyl esterase/lipase
LEVLARSSWPAPVRQCAGWYLSTGCCAPIPAQPGTVVARILVLHGDADPLATFDEVVDFRREMRSAGANWEFDIYGGARHSFTGEGITNQETPEAGLHRQSESRSWRAVLEFLKEVLGKPDRGDTPSTDEEKHHASDHDRCL